jgi:hypothetical protein
MIPGMEPKKKKLLENFSAMHDVAEIHSTPQMTAQNIMSQCAESNIMLKNRGVIKLKYLAPKLIWG